MGRYLTSRFTPILEIPNASVSRDPDNHPNEMKMDMNVVLNDARVNTGAWWVAEYTSTNAPEAFKNQPKNKFYVVFYPMQNGSIHPSAKLLAAPCPPFCENEQGG